MPYMNTVVNSIFIPDITTIEVINVILLLKNSYTGWDDIPAYVMKRCINIYIEPLTHIIDKSIKEGVFPSELKLAKVVPIANLVVRVKLQTTDLFCFIVLLKGI